jgi:hypothetical protein
MPALLALIPIKDWFYGAIIVGLLLFGWHEVEHLKAEGAAHEVAALKVSSDKLVAQEAAHVALVAKNYAAAAAATTETLNAQIQTASTQHAADLKRVQDFADYRRSHPDVASATQPAAGAGTSGTGQSEDFDSELRLSSVSLADALRDSSSALSACMVDRNSLTGKP